MDIVLVIVLVVLVVIWAGGALWYLLWLTEGMYLGWPVVAWLYDLYAARYDRTKHYDRTYETFFLARPIINRMKKDGVAAPLILDVATGTGRIPRLLLDQDDFQGRVVGLDISRKMLFHAAVKLHREDRGVLVWHSVAELPFPADTFDLVTCIEAWEFFPHAKEDLRELVRVLRPGGSLMITNRTGSDARVMPGKTLSTAALRDWLTTELGMVDVEDNRWQVDYDLFWARKVGDSDPAGPRLLAEIVRCSQCGGELVPTESSAWVCLHCEKRARVGDDGVLELLRMK
ncbi:methyltransferase domain-containing protein [Chloroflexota bacterium]